MKRYDPNHAPHPAEWLELDEQERILLIERFHRRVREQVESPRAHAVVHAVVETQLAMDNPTTVRPTLTRLMSEGLDRHEAIHAIGSVLAEYMFQAISGSSIQEISNAAYAQALSKLTAASWRAL